MKNFLVLLIVATWSFASSADVQQKWFRDVMNDQEELILSEVNQAKDLLQSGVPAPVCGYRASRTYAPPALRATLLQLKNELQRELVVSVPSVTPSGICVTVQIK